MGRGKRKRTAKNSTRVRYLRAALRIPVFTDECTLDFSCFTLLRWWLPLLIMVSLRRRGTTGVSVSKKTLLGLQMMLRLLLHVNLLTCRIWSATLI